MSKIKILIADDHKILRQGIRSLLAPQPDFEVIGETADGPETLKETFKLKPDVVLMDIGMPNLNGFEATRQIKKKLPEVKVLVLTMYQDDEYVLQALQSGASGYVLKDVAVEELVTAIRAVNNEQYYLSPSISRTVIDAYLRKTEKGGKEPSELLTAREREIVQLIAEGHTNKEIAAKLFISVKTVDAHRSHIMEKLDIHDMALLVKYAIRKGITDLHTKR
ncbi:MAG: response regulator transcription factor [candidate division Zixibacteria bacterium]|nr:response regulator transcription factor [candidate division Zixibacteria bacterium]